MDGQVETGRGEPSDGGPLQGARPLVAEGASAPVREVLLHFPIAPEAPARARAALRGLVEGTPAARLDDAALVLSELVTNAVLHGRTPLSVLLRLTGDVLRVEVADDSAIGPSFSMLDPTAVTGRGLLLVSELADAWGIEPRGTGKAVWCELRAGGQQAQTATDVDVLLAAWGEELGGDPALERVRIVLTDLDTVLVARSEAHVEALLRELALLVAAGPAGAAGAADADRLRTAEQVLRAAAGTSLLRSDLRRQLSIALAAGHPLVDLTATVQRDAAATVRAYADAVDAADRLSRTGALLMAPAPVELSDARRSYLGRLLAQLLS